MNEQQQKPKTQRTPNKQNTNKTQQNTWNPSARHDSGETEVAVVVFDFLFVFFILFVFVRLNSTLGEWAVERRVRFVNQIWILRCHRGDVQLTTKQQHQTKLKPKTSIESRTKKCQTDRQISCALSEHQIIRCNRKQTRQNKIETQIIVIATSKNATNNTNQLIEAFAFVYLREVYKRRAFWCNWLRCRFWNSSTTRTIPSREDNSCHLFDVWLFGCCLLLVVCKDGFGASCVCCFVYLSWTIRFELQWRT